MSTVSYKRTMYKLDENLQTKIQRWTNKNKKTSCLYWRDVEWYWCLNGNKPQKIFVSVDCLKWSVMSINSYGNTTSKITGKQTNSHTANFSYRPSSKVLVLQSIWNTDSQHTSLSRACVLFGRGMVSSKWEYKQAKYHTEVLKLPMQFTTFLHVRLSQILGYSKCTQNPRAQLFK